MITGNLFKRPLSNKQPKEKKMKNIVSKNIELFVFILLMTFLAANSYAKEIVINEFMADNASTLADENGEFDDWVELFNPGDQPVNIGGMFITDSLNNLTFWQIPDSDAQRTTIQPGGYLLLWLDKDLNQGILHVNVKLSSDGESIAIVRSDGITIIDSIQFGLQTTDVSLGRKTDAGNEWMPMETPTPGSKNISETYIEQTQPPLLSLDAGFYNASITLVMSAISAQIYYTQIKANPDSYTQPVIMQAQYTQPLIVDETCIVRAYAIEDGKSPSEIITKSYFIHTNYKMPVIALTFDSEQLFDPVEGLYMKGPDVLPDDTWPFWKANYYQGSYYYKGSQLIESWEDYEKKVHIEYFDHDKNLILDIDAGLEMTGVWSRAFPKKSFNIKTRNEYGVNEINYPLFEDNIYDTYDGITLRAGAEDRSRVHNEILYMAWRDAKLRTDMQAYKPVVLLLNGAYWGIYSMYERKDNDLIKNRYGYEDIDLIADWGLVKDGSMDAFQALLNYMNDNDINAPGVYDDILQKINIGNFMDHCLMQVYSSHGDPNNVRYWRPRTSEGQWHWIIYDFDWLNSYEDTTLSDYAAITQVNSIKQLGYMLQHPEFRNSFINRLADFLNTTGRAENMLAYIETSKHDIETEIEADIARWVDWENMEGKINYNMGSYQWEVNWMTDFVKNRPEYLFQEIVNLYSPSGTAKLSLTTGQGNGHIRVNSTDIEDPLFFGTYFKDIPISITAVPALNYTFAGWSEMEGGNTLTNIYLSNDLSLTANFVPILYPVIINEINYNSVETFLSGDWVELFNRSASDIDISGWHFKDSDDSHDYVIPDNTILGSGEYLVLAEDIVAFQSTYSDVSNVIGGFSFGLSGGGEAVRLFNADDNFVNCVIYDDIAPWPTGADGMGATLELISPEFDNSIPDNWGDSTIKNGTPGQPNSVLNPFQSIQNIIRMLQIVTGSSVHFPVPIPDIDANNQIGLAEVIYGLQTVSGLLRQ
jgi:hypothetical protein